MLPKLSVIANDAIGRAGFYSLYADGRYRGYEPTGLFELGVARHPHVQPARQAGL
jgi:hypothetical protein